MKLNKKLALANKETLVIEIGPGIGALTQMLSQEAKKVIAYEIDERLPEVLAYSLEDCDNVEIILEDFMQVDLKAIVDQYPDDDVVVAANLPYYITTPILFKIFESNADIKRITVMMQKEVADRFSATVNSKDYNALSVITQYRTTVKQVVKVPRNVFNPKPNVDSSVLQFEFKEKDTTVNEELFFSMVKACFKQRRKTILNNFGEWLNDKESARVYLEEAGIDVEIIRLVGVMNRTPFKKPTAIPEYVLIFEGKKTSDFYEHEYETDDVRFFPINDLPEISPKVTEGEIKRMINSALSGETIFD